MKALMLGAAALSMLAAPAFAQSTSTVPVTATVAGLCGLGAQSGGGATTSSVVNFPTIVDGNGQLTATPTIIDFGNVWCNGPSTLTLAATQLVNPTPVSDTSSFVNAVDMIVDSATGTGGSIFVYMGGATQVRSGLPVIATPGAAFESGSGRFQQARLTLALPASTVGNDRPIAGTYTGAITLVVAPN